MPLPGGPQFTFGTGKGTEEEDKWWEREPLQNEPEPPPPAFPSVWEQQRPTSWGGSPWRGHVDIAQPPAPTPQLTPPPQSQPTVWMPTLPWQQQAGGPQAPQALLGGMALTRPPITEAPVEEQMQAGALAGPPAPVQITPPQPTLPGIQAGRYGPTVPSGVRTPTVQEYRDELEQSPQHTQSVIDLYRQVSENVGTRSLLGIQFRASATPFEVAQAMQQQASLPPLDLKATPSELRKTLAEGRVAAAGNDLMNRLAAWHEQRAEEDRQRGEYALAARQEQLAAAARLDVGSTSVGYLGEWLEQPGRIMRAGAGRYLGQPGSWMGMPPTIGASRFANATPDELDAASVLIHQAAHDQEEQERGLSLPHIVQHARGMLETLVQPGKAEARWNPEGLPVPTQPSDVRPFLVARYGDTPEVRNAAAWAESMSMSGTERMLEAAERILAGEDPYAVIFGHRFNLTNPTERDYKVYADFLDATQRRGLDPNEAAQYVQNNGYIPGAAHSWRELAGSVWVDPTNLVSIGDLLGLIGPGASVRRAAKRWTQAANDALDVSRIDPDTLANLNRALGSAEEATEAVAQPGPLRRLLHNLTHPLEFTPEAKATQIREPATMLATLLSQSVHSADDAKRLVKLLAESPEDLAEIGLLHSLIARSQPVADVMPLFQRVADELDDFASLKRQQFSVTRFTDELAWHLRDAADDLAGVTAVKQLPDVLLADAVRNFMRDFWMPGNPGYVVRNMSGDIGVLTWDGIMTFDSWDDVTAYLERMPVKTSRLMGITEAGPLAGMEGGLANAPYIGGTVKQLRRMVQTGEIPYAHSRLGKALGLDKAVGGSTILGESNRYARGAVRAYQRADALFWRQLDVPQVLEDTLGATEARRLWGNLQATLPDEEAELAIREFLSGRRLRFGIEGFMDDVSDLSPGMKANLNQDLTKALSIEDPVESQAEMARVLEKALDDVRGYTDQMIGTGATPPMRKVVSTQGTTQDAKEAALAVGAMAQAMGVPDQEALQGGQRVMQAIRDADDIAAEAELRALRRVRESQLPPDVSRAVLMDVRTSVESQRQSTRAAVDALRDQAWDDYNGNRAGGTGIWRRFRADATTSWEDFQGFSRSLTQRADDAIARLGQGEPLIDVLPDHDTVMRSATQRYTDLFEQLAEQDEALRLGQGPRLTEFYKDLNEHRLANDMAGDFAWRMAIENPSVDAIDILDSAERDIAELARVARGKHDLALVQLQTGQVDYGKYLELVQEAWWKGFWDQAPHRYMQAATEIADAGGLKEALSSSALRDVAKKAGVDVADLAAIGQDGWRDLRNSAARMSQAVHNQIVNQTGMRNVRWAGQLDDLVWPMDADDVARWMGHADPSELSADEWREVARIADVQLQKWQSSATEVGRRSRVAAYSRRQPELREGMGALAGQQITGGALSRTEEEALLRQLTQETRGTEEQFVRWLLGQAGYNETDLANLNLQQQQRLLHELGTEDLLMTSSGAPSQIGDLSATRRQHVLDGLPEPVRELARRHFVGGADDPLQAVVAQWEHVQREASDWAEMLDAGVPPTTARPQRFFEAEGYPVLRFGRERVQELLDEAKPLYQRHAELDEVRRFAGQRYSAWADVPFDDTTRLASANWMAMDGSQVATADRMAARNGMATAPRVADVAQAAEKQQTTALKRLKEKLTGGVWDDALDARAGKLTETQLDAIRTWYKEDFRPLNHARQLVVGDAARDMADFALLDYTRRRNFDTMLAQVVPYHYWYTRSARNWAARFAAHPQVLRQYLAYKRWMRRENEQRQYPSRLEGMVEVPAGFLPEWTGGRAFVDPGRYVWPFQALMNQYAVDDLDEAGEHGLVDSVYRYAKVLGLEPFPHLKVAMILTGLVDMDPEEIYNFFPQTAPLQGVTAGLRELGVQQVPPGGFFLEAPVQRALGLVEMPPTGPYLIGRQAVGMQFEHLAAGQPAGERTMLMALELLYAVEHKELRQGEAMGLPLGDVKAPQTPGTYVSEKVRTMAERNRWTPEELHAAQVMLAQATQRASLETATHTVPGFFGLPFYLYTPGEEMARQKQRELGSMGYSELPKLGSKELRDAYLEQHPEVRGRPLTYGLLPGVAEGEMGPQDTLNWMDYSVGRVQIEDDYQKRIDNHIRDAPYDTAGTSALRQQRAVDLAALRTQVYGAEDTYDEEELWSVYGATPEERQQRRREQVLSIISANEPRLEDYMDPQTGEPDYDAWGQAKDDYYELGIKAILEADPAIQKMLLEQPLQEFLMEALPFTEEAKRWFRKIDIPVLGPGQTDAMGWAPTQGEHGTVLLGYPDWGGSIHEMTHAWWHEARQNNPKMMNEFVEAFLEFANSPEPKDERYAEAWRLAQEYVHGIPDQPGFEQGMLLPREHWGEGGGPNGEWNDWEMFAGLSSGVRGDLNHIPPELKQYYDKLLSGKTLEETAYVYPEELQYDIISRLETLTGGDIKITDIEAYRRRNDSPLEAAQRTYNELYSMAWEAYNQAVEEGEDKAVAYRTHIEGLPAMKGYALIQAIQKEYPDRWTDEELREALAGVQFPSGDETQTLRKPQAEQDLERARDEFYQWYNQHVPPGQFEYDMRDEIPLLNAIKDFTTRQALDESGFTTEQYREVLKMVQAYVKDNPPQIGAGAYRPEAQPGPENIADALAGVRSGTSAAQEYTFARGMNTIFTRFREQKFPGMGDLLAYRQQKWGDRYLSKAERDERDAFDAQHPELAAYRDWEQAFAMEHQVWAKYYRPWLLEEEGEGGGEGESGGEGRGTYYGAGYYGGGYNPIGSWADFANMIDTDTMTALFRLWGDGAALSGDARARLKSIWEKYGWTDDFDDWLTWLQRLYQRAFASQAANVPGVKYTHWLSGVWNTK